MKYFLLILLIIFLSIGIYSWQFNKKEKPAISPPPPLVEETVNTSSNLEKMLVLDFKDRKYRYTVNKIKSIANLTLASNLADKKSALQLKKENNCRFLINGGFYSKNNEVLGQFVVDRKQISAPIKSALLDGMIYSKNKQVKIGLNSLVNDSDWVLQSGPLLIFENQATSLKIIDDQLERRMLAGLNDKSELLFIAITGYESLGRGPYLADLPQITLVIAEQLGEKFVSAINLDGGTASAFLTDEIEVEENNFIGSYFCEK